MKNDYISWYTKKSKDTIKCNIESLKAIIEKSKYEKIYQGADALIRVLLTEKLDIVLDAFGEYEAANPNYWISYCGGEKVQTSVIPTGSDYIFWIKQLINYEILDDGSVVSIDYYERIDEYVQINETYIIKDSFSDVKRKCILHVNSEILPADLNAKLITKFNDIIDIIEERKSYHKQFESIFAERYDDYQKYKPDEEHKLRINLAKSLGLIDKKWKYK